MINIFLELQIHHSAVGVDGATGDRALKVVERDSWRDLVQIQLAMKVALVQLKKRKDAKYGITIVKVLTPLNEIYLCILSGFNRVN